MPLNENYISLIFIMPLPNVINVRKSIHKRKTDILAKNQKKVITLTNFSKISIAFPYQIEKKHRYLITDNTIYK